MTPITDKIKQLPDGYRLFLSNTNGAFTRDSEIDTDDLKSLVSDLEAKTWALELLDLIDVFYGVKAKPLATPPAAPDDVTELLEPCDECGCAKHHHEIEPPYPCNFPDCGCKSYRPQPSKPAESVEDRAKAFIDSPEQAGWTAATVHKSIAAFLESERPAIEAKAKAEAREEFVEEVEPLIRTHNNGYFVETQSRFSFNARSKGSPYRTGGGMKETANNNAIHELKLRVDSLEELLYWTAIKADRFEVGDRVEFSPIADRKGISRARKGARGGVVKAIKTAFSIDVLLDGYKKSTSFHHMFFQQEEKDAK